MLLQRHAIVLVGLLAACQRGQTLAELGDAQRADASPFDAALPVDAAAPPDAPTDAPPEPAHVALPRSPETPPHKTHRPLARRELDRLTKLEFADFQRQDHGPAIRAAYVEYMTKTRPILGVTVRIEPCGRGLQACRPMILPRWTMARAQLKQSINPVLAARADTRFDIAARPLTGATAISTYALGAYFGKDDKGLTGVYTDIYTLYYNDGVNQIRVSAAYLDDPVGGIDQLLRLAPPDDLDKLAAAFLNYFIHEWRD